MKIVVTSDVHADAATAGYPRFDDVRDAMLASVEYAIEHEADVYLFLGDLCDPDAPDLIRCIRLAQEVALRLSDQQIESYWLAGNHDVLEDGFGTTTLDLIDAIERATVVSGFRSWKIGTKAGVPCIFLPYTALKNQYDPIKMLKSAYPNGSKDVKLIAGHLMLEGISIGSETEDFPRGRDIFFPIDECKQMFPNATLINGHVHERQVYRGVHIPGALIRLTKADVGRDPCFLELDI